jgi:hypothetical protein
VDQVLPSVLRSLGVPSRSVTRQVVEAWERAADERWRAETAPRSLVVGVLVVGVASSSLRQELQEFHRERLLAVLRASLPKVPIARLHFVEEPRPRPTA